MDDEGNPGQPAEIPDHRADAYEEAMHGGGGLSGQEHTESKGNGFVSFDAGEYEGKAERDKQEAKTEDFINKHVVGRVFHSPNGSWFSIYDGGRRYYGRDDSLYRARKSRAE